MSLELKLESCIQEQLELKEGHRGTLIELADQIKDESPMLDVMTKKVARLEQDKLHLKNQTSDLEAELLAKNAEISSVLSGIEGVKSRIKIV